MQNNLKDHVTCKPLLLHVHKARQPKMTTEPNNQNSILEGR